MAAGLVESKEGDAIVCGRSADGSILISIYDKLGNYIRAMTLTDDTANALFERVKFVVRENGRN